MFEIVDTTSDDMYFHLAFYANIETAINELNKRLDKDCNITDSADYEDHEKIEIREYPIGWNSDYKTVYKVERNKVYEEDADDYVWKTTVA
jgi:hypothetical protein